MQTTVTYTFDKIKIHEGDLTVSVTLVDGMGKFVEIRGPGHSSHVPVDELELLVGALQDAVAILRRPS